MTVRAGVGVAFGDVGVELAEDDDTGRAPVDAEGTAGADVVVDREDHVVGRVDTRLLDLDRLRNENAALKKGASSSLRLKVSEKGALSVYGMGRFPVTLYKEQWLKLLGVSDEIRALIAANEGQLKAKD